MAAPTSSGSSASTPVTFPPLSPGILHAATSDGGVVYDLVTEKLSFLNPSGAALCAACEGRSDRHALIAEWAEGARVDVGQVQRDVDAGLETFTAAGFVGRSDPPRQIYLPDAPVTPLGEGEFSTTLAAGVHRVRVRGRDAELVAAVDELFDLASSDAPTAEFHLVGEPDGTIRLVTDTEWRFAGRADMVTRLVMVVNDFVARTTTDIVLHAAALRDPEGAVVVFPAAPGSGKSTLAALLVQRGWAYLGDESATIRTGDLAVVPCAKPIELDATSCEVLGLPADCAGDVPLDQITAEAVKVRTPGPPPAAIVAPTYVGPRGEAAITTLDRTDALVTLVAGALNLRYVGTPGLETLVDLAATVPTHTITYRSSAEAVEQIAALTIGSPNGSFTEV